MNYKYNSIRQYFKGIDFGNWDTILRDMVDQLRHEIGCGDEDLVWEMPARLFHDFAIEARPARCITHKYNHRNTDNAYILDIPVKLLYNPHSEEINAVTLKYKKRVDYASQYDAMKMNFKEDKMKRSEYIFDSAEGAFLATIDKVTIKDVMFKPPATIVFWSDNTKTSVVCRDGDIYDPEKGLALAICKKAYGNTGGFNDIFKKWLPKEEDKNEETGPCYECTHMPTTKMIWSGSVCLSESCRECIKGMKNNFKKKEK